MYLFLLINKWIVSLQANKMCCKCLWHIASVLSLFNIFVHTRLTCNCQPLRLSAGVPCPLQPAVPTPHGDACELTCLREHLSSSDWWELMWFHGRSQASRCDVSILCGLKEVPGSQAGFTFMCSSNCLNKGAGIASFSNLSQFSSLISMFLGNTLQRIYAHPWITLVSGKPKILQAGKQTIFKNVFHINLNIS